MLFRSQNYLCSAGPDAANTTLRWYDPELRCGFAATPIIYAEDCNGYITTIETQKHGLLTDMALENAATFAALTIATNNSTKEKERMIQRGIFSDLLFRKSYTQENVSNWLNYFKWQIDHPYAVVLIQAELEGPGELPGGNEQLLQNSLVSLGQRVKEQFPQVFYLLQQDSLILIHDLTPVHNQCQRYPDSFQAGYRQLLDNYRQIFPFLRLTACCGKAVAGLEQISDSYQQAQIGLEIAKKISSHQGNGCFCYDNLDIYHIFTEYGDKEELRGLVKKYLGPLLDMGQNRFDALTTLEAYIHCSCSITDSAQKLFLHPNTMKYRIAKIRETLNNPLDDPQYIYSLFIVLLINRLL